MNILLNNRHLPLQFYFKAPGTFKCKLSRQIKTVYQQNNLDMLKYVSLTWLQLMIKYQEIGR